MTLPGWARMMDDDAWHHALNEYKSNAQSCKSLPMCTNEGADFVLQYRLLSRR